MMSKERIHELREMAVHQGLFVEGVCDEGIRVTFFEPIYVNEVFLIKEEPLMCPVCGSFLLEFEEQFKHQYDYTHVCANTNCSYNGNEIEEEVFYDCNCDCCSCTTCTAEAESTLGLELNLVDRAKMLFKRVIQAVKELYKL